MLRLRAAGKPRRAVLVSACVVLSAVLLAALSRPLLHSPESHRNFRNPGQSDDPGFVPQYAIGTAVMSTSNALNAVSVALSERPLRIQQMLPLEQQNQVLQNALAASLSSVEAVRNNATRDRPQAVPAAEWAIAELLSARAQAEMFASALHRGEMGPDYIVSLSAAGAHLRAANQYLAALAQQYGMPKLAPPLSVHQQTAQR